MVLWVIALSAPSQYRFPDEICAGFQHLDRAGNRRGEPEMARLDFAFVKNAQ